MKPKQTSISVTPRIAVRIRDLAGEFPQLTQYEIVDLLYEVFSMSSVKTMRAARAKVIERQIAEYAARKESYT